MTLTDSRPARTNPMPGGTGAIKCLTFTAAGQTFGVSIEHVREVVIALPMTVVPNLAPWFRGVINLRGEIVPVMDLTTRLGLAAAAPPARPCLVVVTDPRGGDPRAKTALLVDAVAEILAIADANLQTRDTLDASLATSSVAGVARARNGLIMLLDVARVLSNDAQAAPAATR